MELGAVILAGGESRRMGQDKAWMEIDGRPLIRRTLSLVQDLGVREVLISGRPGVDYSSLGCPVLVDLEPGFGPVAGIERGLQACHSPLLLVLAVDLPRMSTAFLRELIARCSPLTGVVPTIQGEPEPLAAIYPKRCHPLAAECLMGGRRAARDFVAACLRERAVRRFPVAAIDRACFQNCNTPGDL